MFKPQSFFLAAVGGVLLLAGAAHAATISYDGKLTDVGPTATASTSPYLSDGYTLFNTGSGTTLTSNPGYVSGVSNTGNANFSGFYSSFDNPKNGNAPTGAGLTANKSATPGPGNILSITLTGSVPSTFYVGVLENESTGAGDYPQTLGLTDGTATTGQVSTNGVPDGKFDLQYFTVSGAAPGDVLVLSGTQNSVNGDGHYYISTSGVLFTSKNPVPEPATLGILALGAVGLLGRRKKICRN